MMRIRAGGAVLAALVLFLVSSHGWALGMTPMSMELSASGSGSRSHFVVKNDGAAPAAVEVTVETLSYTEDGKSIRTPVDDETLLISPSAAMIKPGASQVFRVQWVGEPDVRRSYLVMATQLPLRDRSGKPVVQITQAFGAIVVVSPPNGRSDLRLVDAKAVNTADGKPALSILVENPTGVHALISRTALRIGETVLQPGDMRVRVGLGVVEPGKRRRFVVPLDAPVAGQRVTLEYRNER
ncbi:putative Fimbria/pilus periplasmic chaperone [Hyphomicrobium sp. 1Nfss2.1]|uniref:fimbrial biogenesis chaperone n=1 Tax=Hyphomicrobium sp. 1Nfss2.1 TaxID=3413936 RepID=UPI003C7B32DF